LTEIFQNQGSKAIIPHSKGGLFTLHKEPIAGCLIETPGEPDDQKHSYQLNENCDLKTRTLALKTHIFPQKTRKLTPKSKSGATSTTIFCNRVKITTFLNHGIK
jgi:hypothetical protein